MLALAYIAEHGGGKTLARRKHRIKHPLFNGYADVLDNVWLPLPGKEGEAQQYHLCEVQMHMSPILAHKKEGHHFYDYFRTHFRGNLGACAEAMEKLEEVCGEEEFSVEMVREVVEEL